MSKRCPKCMGENGNHGLVHVRHGNGGGHNEICPVYRLSKCIHGSGCDERSHGLDCNEVFFGGAA